jgi:hypothetical protein
MALTDDRAPQVRDLEVETGGERVVAGPRLAGTRAFFDTRAEAPGAIHYHAGQKNENRCS